MISAPGRLMILTSQIMTALNKPTGTTGKPCHLNFKLFYMSTNTHAELSMKMVLNTVVPEALLNAFFLHFVNFLYVHIVYVL